MIHMIRIDDIRHLAGPQEGPCVSIYMPTHRGGRKQMEQDPIRFRNQVQRASRDLAEFGLRTPDMQALIGQVEPLFEDRDFWTHQSDGLAMFLSRGGVRHYRLPYRFNEEAVVADRFYVKPLVPLLTNNGKFFILALSKERVRLHQATRESMTELPLDPKLSDLGSAMRAETPTDRNLQFFTGTPHRSGSGRRDAVFFGAHGNVDDMKQTVRRYFQRLDRGLHDYLREERSPLVLAGVEYLFPLFREASRYQNIVEGVFGNVDNEPVAELHRKVWEAVRPRFESMQLLAMQRFEDLMGAGDGQAGDRFTEVIPAAFQGRVDTLFIPYRRPVFGQYDPGTGTVETSRTRRVGYHDLGDLAAIQTLTNSGTVFALRDGEMPGGREIAAIYRY